MDLIIHNFFFFFFLVSTLTLQSESELVFSRLSIPCTHFDLQYVRPDFIMLRVIARNLIMWSRYVVFARRSKLERAVAFQNFKPNIPVVGCTHPKIGFSPRYLKLSKVVFGALEMRWVM